VIDSVCHLLKSSFPTEISLLETLPFVILWLFFDQILSAAKRNFWKINIKALIFIGKSHDYTQNCYRFCFSTSTEALIDGIIYSQTKLRWFSAILYEWYLTTVSLLMIKHNMCFVELSPPDLSLFITYFVLPKRHSFKLVNPYPLVFETYFVDVI